MNTSKFLRKLKAHPAKASVLVDSWFFEYGADDNALVEVSAAIAQGYTNREIPFLWANAAITALMALRNWKAPKAFWTIFIAFEDLEISENPGARGIEHVQAAINELQS